MCDLSKCVFAKCVIVKCVTISKGRVRFVKFVQICSVMGLKLHTHLLYITLPIFDKQLQILAFLFRGQAHGHTTNVIIPLF